MYKNIQPDVLGIGTTGAAQKEAQAATQKAATVPAAASSVPEASKIPY